MRINNATCLTAISSFNILLNTITIIIFTFNLHIEYNLFIINLIIFMLTTCVIPCVFYNFSLTILAHIILIILMIFSIQNTIKNQTDEFIIVINYIYIGNNILLATTEYILKHTRNVVNIYTNFSNPPTITQNGIQTIHTIQPINHYIINLSRVNQNEYKNVCSICLEEVDFYSSKTNCNHYYHNLCLQEWLNRNQNCPNCREPIY